MSPLTNNVEVKNEQTIVCMRNHNTGPKTERHIIGEHKALTR